MYKRILIKISGEALGGGKGKGLDFEVLKEVASEIKKIVSKGVEVGIVVGGRKLLERKELELKKQLQTIWECLQQQ